MDVIKTRLDMHWHEINELVYKVKALESQVCILSDEISELRSREDGKIKRLESLENLAGRAGKWQT